MIKDSCEETKWIAKPNGTRQLQFRHVSLRLLFSLAQREMASLLGLLFSLGQ
jgi:hypothetical protein